jgi:hypothetical protein
MRLCQRRRSPALDGTAHCILMSTMQPDPSVRPWSYAHHSLDRVQVASAPQPAPPWLAHVQSPRGLPAGPDCPPHCPHIGASAAITGPSVGATMGPSVGAALGAVGPCAGRMTPLDIVTACPGIPVCAGFTQSQPSVVLRAINLRTFQRELLATLKCAAAPAHCHPLSAVLPKLQVF